MDLIGLVRVLHVALILFIIVTPFITTSWSIRALHLVTIVGILVHWFVNDDTCFLTMVESKLRGIPPTSSFMYSLVNPIYKVQDETLSKLSKVLLPLLGIITTYQLYRDGDHVMLELSMILSALKE